MSTLRSYQAEACEGAMREFASKRSTLLVMATGTGKTVCFAEVAGRFIRNEKRVLVIAHREELLAQAREKMRGWLDLREDEIGLERAEVTSAYGLLPPPVVVASVQTLSRPKRLALYGPDDFGLVIVDEAHHSTSASYRAVIDYFTGAKILGVTATPDRADEKAMGIVFESVAFVYEIRDAIEQGFLAPIRQKAVEVESLDLSAVRTTAGDLNEGDLDELMREKETVHRVTAPLFQLAEKRKTLVFGVTVAHAVALAEELNSYLPQGSPPIAASIDGGMDRARRRDLLRGFEAGEFQFLANCQIATEGFDLPAISCVAIARPTKSRALYCQMVGRGTRLAPEKKDLLVLDFMGNAGKHSLVSALDILDGNMDPEVKAKAQKLITGREDLTVMDALDEARAEIVEEKRRRIQVQARAKMRVSEIDPFTVVGVSPNRDRWGGVAATEKQVQLLAGYQVDAKTMTKGEASELIDGIFSRSKRGLCSFRQARVLLRYGLDPDVSYDAASRTIDTIAKNGWRLPTEARAS